MDDGWMQVSPIVSRRLDSAIYGPERLFIELVGGATHHAVPLATKPCSRRRGLDLRPSCTWRHRMLETPLPHADHPEFPCDPWGSCFPMLHATPVVRPVLAR